MQPLVQPDSEPFVFLFLQIHNQLRLYVGELLLPRRRMRVHPDDRWITDPSRDQILKAKPLEYEVRLLMPDGRVKWVHVTAHTRKNEERGRLDEYQRRAAAASAGLEDYLPRRDPR